jgi:hypothetical protein
MSETMYAMTLGLPLITVMLVCTMKYWASVQQAKASLANDEAYRRLAEKSEAAHIESARLLDAIDVKLTDMNRRVIAVEKILKEVE